MIESARILVELLSCIITSKEARVEDKDMAAELSRQVTHWAAARKFCETGERFSVNDHKQQ